MPDNRKPTAAISAPMAAVRPGPSLSAQVPASGAVSVPTRAAVQLGPDLDGQRVPASLSTAKCSAALSSK